jgi:hypothetical protein
MTHDSNLGVISSSTLQDPEHRLHLSFLARNPGAVNPGYFGNYKMPLLSVVKQNSSIKARQKRMRLIATPRPIGMRPPQHARTQPMPGTKHPSDSS